MTPDSQMVFLEYAAQRRGLPAIIAHLAELTDCPCCFCDPGLQILAGELPDWDKPDLPPAVLDNLTPLAHSANSGVVLFQGQCAPWGSYLAAMPDSAQPLGYIFLISRNPAHHFPLTAAALSASVECSRLEQEQRIHRHYQNEFILDLLYNNITNAAMIAHRAQLWGFDLSQPYQLLLLAPASHPGTVVFCRDWSGHLETIIRRTTAGAIISDHDDQLIVLVHRPQGPASQRKELIQWLNVLQEQLSVRAPGMAIIAGIGRFYPQPNNLHRAYQEAKVAITVGHHIQGSPFIFFDDLGVLRLVFQQNLQDLEDYVEQTIGPLLQYDPEHDSDLMSSLLVYLEKSGDIKKAADTLYIHVNTLRYRIKKIEELLNVDLRQYSHIVTVQTALQIHRMISIPHSSGGF